MKNIYFLVIFGVSIIVAIIVAVFKWPYNGMEDFIYSENGDFRVLYTEKTDGQIEINYFYREELVFAAYLDREHIKTVRSRGREQHDFYMLTVNGNVDGWSVITMKSFKDDITMVYDLTGDGFPESMTVAERESGEGRKIR